MVAPPDAPTLPSADEVYPWPASAEGLGAEQQADIRSLKRQTDWK